MGFDFNLTKTVSNSSVFNSISCVYSVIYRINSVSLSVYIGILSYNERGKKNAKITQI